MVDHACKVQCTASATGHCHGTGREKKLTLQFGSGAGEAAMILDALWKYLQLTATGVTLRMRVEQAVPRPKTKYSITFI